MQGSTGGAISQSNNTVTVVEAPRRSDLVVRLLKNLKPQVVVTCLADYEMRTSTSFELLLDATANIGARLILDISEYLELSSLPGSNGVLQYLASHPMPMHATIICGLVKNQVPETMHLTSRRLLIAIFSVNASNLTLYLMQPVRGYRLATWYSVVIP